MKTQNIKRVLAGMLAISLCATCVPLTVVAADEAVHPAEETVDMTYAEMLEQLNIITDCLTFPYFMVSEGDSVYINGEKVATTTVEVDRNLAFSGEAKKYWLDAKAYTHFFHSTLDFKAKLVYN